MAVTTKPSYTYLAWVWLTSLGGSTGNSLIVSSWSRRFAVVYADRKPWRLRSLAWEAYIKAEKQLKPERHMPAEFFRSEPTFVHVRKPWKLTNTYQVIRRLEHS